jgi:hypothetical protein
MRRSLIPLLWVPLLALLLLTAACATPAAAPDNMPTTAAPTSAPESAPPVEPNPTAAPPVPQPFVDPADWPAPEPGAIHVDAAQRFGPISPLVYGSNIDPAMVVPVDLTEQAAVIGLRFLRFPGGSFGDLNDITPQQVDRFITLARGLGAEPSIHVRVLDRTAADAAEAVRYANIEQGYGVRYWAIGNEPSLFYNEVYTAESYAQLWREFALAMRAVDPSIILVGPEITQFATAELAGRSDVARAREWMRAFLTTNGDLVDIVSIHRYPFPAQANQPSLSVAELRPTSAEFDVSIPELRAMIRDLTGRDIPVAVTEVNSDSSPGIGGEASLDSPFAAVWLTDVLGRLIRQDATIVAQYAFQTADSRGRWGLLNRYNVRPQYYVYQLYQRFGTELVYAGSDDPDVTAYAALRDGGALTLLVVNLGDEMAEKPLRLAGAPGGSADIYRLDAKRIDAATVATPVETLALADGATLSLPPQSATLIVWASE